MEKIFKGTNLEDKGRDGTQEEADALRISIHFGNRPMESSPNTPEDSRGGKK